MKLLMARARLNLLAAASGAAGVFQIVEQQSASFTGTSSPAVMTFTNTVQDGDFVVVAVSRASTGGTLNVSDSNGTAYNQEAVKSGTNGVTAHVRASAAQVAATDFSVTASITASGSGEAVAYLLRGLSSLVVDTANVESGASAGGAVASGATHDLGAYSTSGAAFVAVAVATYQNGVPTAPWGFGNSALTQDVDTLIQSGGHSALIGHAVTAGAVSGQTFQDVSSNTGTSGNDAWVLVPFLIG